MLAILAYIEEDADVLELVTWLFFSGKVYPRAWLNLSRRNLPKVLKFRLTPLEKFSLILYFVLSELEIDPARLRGVSLLFVEP